MLDNPENPSAEENKESIRDLVKKVATDQLEALGYGGVLDKIKEWFTGQPLRGFEFSPGITPDLKMEFEKGLLEAYLNQLLRISSKDEARKLVAAAVFGEPFSQDLISSYVLEEPSIKSVQTQNEVKFVPNIEGSRRLAVSVANTGFIPKGKSAQDVNRQLSWGAKMFRGTHRDDPSVKMEITPQGSSYRVQIHKTPGVAREIHP